MSTPRFRYFLHVGQAQLGQLTQARAHMQR